MQRRENLLYVGLDLHKQTHTAVLVNCWNEKLAAIVIENKPSAFKKLAEKVNKKANQLGLYPIYGLENACGYGRSLAVWLVEKGCIVKDVNASLAYNQRKSAPMMSKNDEYDAYAVATVLINQLHKLPDANPTDHYWTLAQLVNRRDIIVKDGIRLKNGIHEQLMSAYPNYHKFFSEIDGKCAMYFWKTYPSPSHLENKTAEELTEELKEISKSFRKDKAELILDCVRSDGNTYRDYQESRDFITRGDAPEDGHYDWGGLIGNVTGGIAVGVGVGLCAYIGVGALAASSVKVASLMGTAGVTAGSVGVSTAAMATGYTMSLAISDVMSGRVSRTEDYIRKALAGSVVGFLAGASPLARAGMGAGGSMAVGALEGAAGSAASQWIIKGAIKLDQVIMDGTFSGLVELGMWNWRNAGKGTSVIDDVKSGKTTLDTTKQKDNFGEMVMDEHYKSLGYERVSVDKVTGLDDTIKKGIDGVYYNPNGKPPYIIGEAKYGTSTLSKTKDGLQMSGDWIEGSKRLETAVGKDLADDILLEGYKPELVNIKTDGSVTVKPLDKNGKVVN